MIQSLDKEVKYISISIETTSDDNYKFNNSLTTSLSSKGSFLSYIIW